MASAYPRQRDRTFKDPRQPTYKRPDRPKPSRELPGRKVRPKVGIPFRPYHHKVKPFGPTPNPFDPVPLQPRRHPKLGHFRRAFPGLAAAGALYTFYQWSKQQSAGFDLTGWTMYGSCTGRGMGPFIPNSVVCGPLVKTASSRGIQTQNLGATKRYRAMFLDQNAYVDELDRSIGQAAEWWEITLPAATPAPTIPVIPGQPGVWMPPADWPAPQDWPKPEFKPQPQPKTDPAVGEPLPPGVFVPWVPVISVPLNPDGRTQPKVDRHELRPPEPKTKERKPRLDGPTGLRWLGKLDKLLNGFTEADDFVDALYKGLHWTVRRWRGRDGVWRDRDITTDGKLKTLYRLATSGKWSVSKAFQEVVKNEVEDRVIGKLGSGGERLARTRYWSSVKGPGFGGRLQKDQWDAMYKKLAEKQGKLVKAGRFTQWKKGADGSWRKVTVKRTKTHVPWLRREGVRSYWDVARPGTRDYYSRPVNRKKPYLVVRPRYYYASGR